MGGQPTDTMGGQYASFSGGTPEGGGFDWSAFGQGAGKGLQTLGQGFAPTAASTYSYTPNMSNYPSAQIPLAPSGGGQLIPATGQSDDQEVMAMLRRLLSQIGGST